MSMCRILITAVLVILCACSVNRHIARVDIDALNPYHEHLRGLVAKNEDVKFSIESIGIDQPPPEVTYSKEQQKEDYELLTAIQTKCASHVNNATFELARQSDRASNWKKNVAQVTGFLTTIGGGAAGATALADGGKGTTGTLGILTGLVGLTGAVVATWVEPGAQESKFHADKLGVIQKNVEDLKGLGPPEEWKKDPGRYSKARSIIAILDGTCK